jgi:hypothetical protein
MLWLGPSAWTRWLFIQMDATARQAGETVVPAPTLIVGVNAGGQHRVVDFPSVGGEQQWIVYLLEALYE